MKNLFFAFLMLFMAVSCEKTTTDNTSSSEDSEQTDQDTDQDTDAGADDDADDDADGEDETTVVSYSTFGTIQKGPFVKGTTITIYELDSIFTQTGVTHITETTDDLGSYTISGVASKYAEIVAKGYYYNEVTGEISTSELELSSISDISTETQANVNILTALASKKIKTLVADGETSYEEAVTQAETEIAESGEVTDQTIIQSIEDSASNVDIEQVKENLDSYYTSQDVEIEIPTIEDIVDTTPTPQLKDLDDYQL